MRHHVAEGSKGCGLLYREKFPHDHAGDQLYAGLPTAAGDVALHEWLMTRCDVEPTGWGRLPTPAASLGTPLTVAMRAWIEAEVQPTDRIMSFDVAIGLLPPAAKAEIEDHLKNLASLGARSRALAKSLFAERQLGIIHWAELLNALQNSPGELGVQDWGCRNRYQGAAANPSIPVGRVVEKNTFVASLMSFGRLPRQIARDVLVDLCSIRQWKHAADILERRRFFLGGDPMWATFDENGRDPFAFSYGSTRKGRFIRACLGLERSPVPQRRYLPILLLRYDGACDYFVPTIADAANYAVWNIYFAPAISHGHGLTQPWDEGDKSLIPRPEVIHRQVTAAQLVAPLEEVR